MKDYKDVTITKKVASSITCNKCGKSTNISDDGWEQGRFQSFSLSFGYGSIYDEETWKFDICESCLGEFVKTFKHAPDVYNI